MLFIPAKKKSMLLSSPKKKHAFYLGEIFTGLCMPLSILKALK